MTWCGGKKELLKQLAEAILSGCCMLSKKSDAVEMNGRRNDEEDGRIRDAKA
jgi:hypothetical protein